MNFVIRLSPQTQIAVIPLPSITSFKVAASSLPKYKPSSIWSIYGKRLVRILL